MSRLAARRAEFFMERHFSQKTVGRAPSRGHRGVPTIADFYNVASHNLSTNDDIAHDKDTGAVYPPIPMVNAKVQSLTPRLRNAAATRAAILDAAKARFKTGRAS